MSHPHPPADGAGYSGGPPPGQYPAYSAPYLGTYTPPSEQRARWPLILVAVVLAVALLAVILKATLRSEPEAPSTSTSALPAAPPMVVPQGSIPATGPGWIMSISPDWIEIPAPVKAKPKVDVAWATGGGAHKFGNNVIVMHEPAPETMTLQQYVTVSVARLPKQVPTAHVVSQHAYDAPGHDYGRVEYTATIEGRRIHGVSYLTRTGDGFVLATYTSVPSLYSRFAPKVEPYLASLRAH